MQTHLGDDYFDTLRHRYDELRYEALKREHEGQGEYQPVILCHAPAVGTILVEGIVRYTGFSTLQVYGIDGSGTACDIIVLPENAQLVMKLLAPSDPEPERRPPVGFTTKPPPEHTESTG